MLADTNSRMTVLAVTEFGIKLKSWRGNRYQKQVAALLDISVRTYQNWEEGVTTPSRFARVEIERLMAANPDEEGKSNA